MLLELITPEKKVFQGEVNSVQLPGTNGKFEVLNNHAPIISTLTNGNVRVIQGTVKEELPPGFQLSQAVLDSGFIDRICHRKDLNEEIGKLLSILLKKNSISTEEINETSEDTQQISKTA